MSKSMTPTMVSQLFLPHSLNFYFIKQGGNRSSLGRNVRSEMWWPIRRHKEKLVVTPQSMPPACTRNRYVSRKKRIAFDVLHVWCWTFNILLKIAFAPQNSYHMGKGRERSGSLPCVQIACYRNSRLHHSVDYWSSPRLFNVVITMERWIVALRPSLLY